MLLFIFCRLLFNQVYFKLFHVFYFPLIILLTTIKLFCVADSSSFADGFVFFLKTLVRARNLYSTVHLWWPLIVTPIYAKVHSLEPSRSSSCCLKAYLDPMEDKCSAIYLFSQKFTKFCAHFSIHFLKFLAGFGWIISK